MEIKVFTATKAFVVHNGKVLIIRESLKYEDAGNVGKFDVPGGRIKPGQRFDESLLREIKEETGLGVKIRKPFFVAEWRPKVRDEQWQIVGIFFKCESTTDKVKLSKDHSEYRWIDPERHNEFELIENLHSAFEAYLEN